MVENNNNTFFTTVGPGERLWIRQTEPMSLGSIRGVERGLDQVTEPSMGPVSILGDEGKYVIKNVFSLS